MKGRWTILIFLFSYHFSISQTINQKVDVFTAQNGLTDNNITATLRDSRGFMWVATENGLNRFDGRSFKQYKTIGENGMTDLNVKCIAEDGEGNIWAGTEFGINKIDPFTEKITRYYEGKGPGTVPYKWCNALYLDKEKNLWFSSEKGIALFNKQTNSFTNYPVSVYGSDPKINKHISKIVEDSKGRFWLATSYGVKLFDRKTKTYQSFHHSETADDPYLNVIYSLCTDKEGNIWAGNYAGTLFKYDPGKNSFDKVGFINQAFRNTTIRDIKSVTLQDKDLLLAATTLGIFSIEQMPTGAYDLRKLITLPDEDLTCILPVNAATLWVGSGNGLMNIKTGHPAFQWTTAFVDPQESVFRIIPDIKDPLHQFYLTQLNGWNHFDPAKKTMTGFAIPFAAQKILTSTNSWIADKNGYWITSIFGFGYYNIYKDQFTDLTKLVIESSGQSTTGFITADTYNNLWLTMRRTGLLVYNPVTQKSDVLFADTTKPGNIFGLAVNDLQTGPGGYIYFTCADKLYKVDPKDRSYKIIRATAEKEAISTLKLAPHQLYFTQGKRIIVSSSLRIYELKDDVLVPIYPAKGYSSFSILNMKGDQKGEIWLNTTEGLFKTDTSFKKLVTMNGVVVTNDLKDLYIKEDGIVLFAGKGGVGILNKELIANSNNPAPPIISRVKYGSAEKYLVSLNPVSIHSSFKDAIEIELSHPGFIDNNASRLFYELQGWDKDWKELVTNSLVRYEQLPPGHYTFKTKTINGEEKESSAAAFQFSIIPPFYRTWWFIGLTSIVLIATVFFLYSYRLKKAVEMERLRTRIATDLHDDIGATLSSISMYSEAVKNQVKEKMPQLESVLNKMGENSREMVTSMSDIVWAINPANDDGEKLTHRMESYARDVCSVKNIQLVFSANEILNETKLSLEQRKNIYLVFKEALNNALKYSLSTKINISLDQQNNKLYLSVGDNGKGFDTKLALKGNGLKNMTLRAQEINATLTISSAQNEGTTIKLVCPV